MTERNILEELNSDILARAIDTTRSPLTITDSLQPDNPIIYANQAFYDLCGYSAKEVLGYNCRFLQGEESDPKTVSQIGAALKAKKSIRVQLKNYRKNGQMFWNDLLVSPIKDTTGKVTHFVGMQLDITERVEYTEQLEIIEKRLRLSNAELEQFTYAASHDLQEPLRMVSSYVQLLQKRYGSTLDDDAKTFMDFASEGAERMQALVNDLLTLSRVSSEGRSFKMISMNEVMERVQFNLKLSLDETKADLTVADLPKVCSDAGQMTQLLQNLLGNALKYRSKNKTPKIIIDVEKQDSEYIFSVSDNGIGIDKAYYERIFTIFQRLHTREEYPGTGVGLAICSKIIERHNGKLWVESKEGKGSTFYFSLPIK